LSATLRAPTAESEPPYHAEVPAAFVNKLLDLSDNLV
jgi:hypothetical protein